MSLYTISSSRKLPLIKIPAGLTTEKCLDAVLLSKIGNTTVTEVLTRFENGHDAFVAYIKNEPAAFGWMAKSRGKIGELNHEFALPAKNRYLWNFRTLAEYRGLGVYPALLHSIINYENDNANRFWIIHAPENKSSLRGIMKAGFEYTGKLYAKANGTIALETVASAELYQSLLNEMNFNPSVEPPASCWNCNSPFLKKRIPECCCTEAETACTGDPAIFMAS